MTLPAVADTTSFQRVSGTPSFFQAAKVRSEMPSLRMKASRPPHLETASANGSVMQARCRKSAPVVNGLLHHRCPWGNADYPAMGSSEHRRQVGNRLLLAMEAVGAKPADVGRLLGISVQKIGNWTRGDNYPDEYLLTVFCDRYGVTMDYLYRGVLRGLDGTLADGLASARAASGQALMAAAPPAREPKRKATKA